jgi:hypothetical protein
MEGDMRDTSLDLVKNKTGRLDCLLHGVAGRLLDIVGEKFNLPVKEGVMPIVEHHIKKHVPNKKVIPEEYKELARIVSERLR